MKHMSNGFLAKCQDSADRYEYSMVDYEPRMMEGEVEYVLKGKQKFIVHGQEFKAGTLVRAFKFSEDFCRIYSFKTKNGQWWMLTAT